MCDDCHRARQSPEYRVFNQACVWCGARYFRTLKTWPTQRELDVGNGETRPESTAERQQWRADVLRWWAAHGHAVDRMKALAGEEAVPYAPVSGRKRSG